MDKMEKAQAPNTWFHYDHPEHGKIEVSAHVPKKAKDSGKVKIHGVGALNDLHISPSEAGIDNSHGEAMKTKAHKLGAGNHMEKPMKKSEREVAIAILDKVKELYKSNNSAHIVEEGSKSIKAVPKDEKIKAIGDKEKEEHDDRPQDNDAEQSESDNIDAKADADKNLAPEDDEPNKVDAEKKDDKDKEDKPKKLAMSEKPLVAFLKKRESNKGDK